LELEGDNKWMAVLVSVVDEPAGDNCTNGGLC